MAARPRKGGAAIVQARLLARLLALLLALFAALGTTPAAWAHHSGAMFDRARTIEINGVVKEFLWINPHASFKVEVQDAQGETKLWYIEMNGVSNLVHEGWKRSTIKPGDKVTVTVNPLRDGRPGGWYLGITLANGTKLGTPATAPAAAADAR
jgi:translation initiation factor IF-1